MRIVGARRCTQYVCGALNVSGPEVGICAFWALLGAALNYALVCDGYDESPTLFMTTVVNRRQGIEINKQMPGKVGHVGTRKVESET